MKEFIKKYEIWIFLILGPIINALFVYARTQGHFTRFIYNNGRFCILLLFLIGLVKYTRGNQGVKDIFKPMLNWKVKPKWYLLSLTFAFTIATITLILKGVYLGKGVTEFLKPNFDVLSIRAVLALLVWAFLGEVVWVSYCIRKLSTMIKPFYASQIIGVVWTLWFIPIILHGEGTLPNIPLLALLLFMLGIAGMCSVIYSLSKSGVCVLLLQYALNITLIFMSISPSTGGIPTFTTFAIIYFITMLCFMYFTNPVHKMRSIENQSIKN
nr:hypothetical protein [uncultured Psychroserpens sp.]